MSFADKILKFLFVFVILLYLVSILFPQLKIDYVLSILCLVIVGSTMFFVHRFVRILGITFLVFGMILLWINKASWHEYISSFGPMLDLITMFTLLPILGIPIKLGSYSNDIQSLIQKKVKTSGHLYMMTSGISYVFSIFMNLATLPMMYHSIRPALGVFSVKSKEQFMSRAITHGYAMPLMWAPVTPIVGVVISVTGVNWISVLPYILPLSLFGLTLDWYMGTRRHKGKSTIPSNLSNNETAATLEVDGNSKPKRVLHILWAILIFNIFISVGEFQLPYSFLILVSLLVIPFAFTWSLLLKKPKEFNNSLQNHFSSFSIRMRDQFFIYLSAGFFISTMKISNTSDLLNSWISQFNKVVGVEAFLILLPLIPLLFAFIGLHPAVTVTLMAEALNPHSLGISPFILTVAMLAGAVSAFLVGPYNATIGLMSSIVKQSSYRVSNWNMSYTGLYIGGVMVYLFLLEWFLKFPPL